MGGSIWPIPKVPRPQVLGLRRVCCGQLLELVGRANALAEWNLPGHHSGHLPQASCADVCLCQVNLVHYDGSTCTPSRHLSTISGATWLEEGLQESSRW